MNISLTHFLKPVSVYFCLSLIHIQIFWRYIFSVSLLRVDAAAAITRADEVTSFHLSSLSQQNSVCLGLLKHLLLSKLGILSSIIV